MWTERPLEIVYNLRYDPAPAHEMSLLCMEPDTNPGFRRTGTMHRRKASEREIENRNVRRRLARVARKRNRR